jgi:hypothetical protein
MDDLSAGTGGVIKVAPVSGLGPHVSLNYLGWRPGQVLRGRVLAQLAENTYVFELNGRNVVARAPSTLVRGQAFTLEVQEERDGQYMVKLLSSGLTRNDGAAVDIFDDLGIGNTPLNRVLIRGLLAQNMPVKPEFLQDAAHMLKILGDNSPENLVAVMLALKLNAPSDQRLLDLLRTYTGSLNETQRGSLYQLNRFLQNLNGWMEKDNLTGLVHFQPGNVPGMLLSKEGESLFRQIDAMLKSMVLKPEGSKGSLIGQLHDLLTAQLPRLTLAEISGRPSSALNPEAVAVGSGIQLAQGDKMPAFSELLEKFSRFFQELREVAKTAGPSREGQRVVLEGEKLERQMAGQQLVQSFKQEGLNQYSLYFTLPFIQTTAGETWGQLKITRDFAKKTDEDSSFVVDIFLQTKNLGPLLIGLKVLNKDVLASGKATEERAARRISEAWPLLQDAFKVMGYQLMDCNWAVGSFEENLQPRVSIPPEETLDLRFLDTRV